MHIYIYIVCVRCAAIVKDLARQCLGAARQCLAGCARACLPFFSEAATENEHAVPCMPLPSAARGHPRQRRAAIRRLRSPDTAVSCIPGDLLACMAQRQELHLAVVAAHPQEQLRASAAVQQRQHIPTTTPQAVVHAFSKQSNDIVSIRRAPEPYDILQYREGYDLMKQS